jgi:hypothetical protein
MQMRSETSYGREHISPNETFDQKLSRRQAYRNAYFTAYPEYWPDAKEISPIFLLGMGRSGTFMTMQLLNLSEGVVAYHEPQPRLWELANGVYHEPEDTDKWASILWAAKRDLMSVVHSLGYVYAECNAFLSVFAHAIERVFPSARYLYVMRDMDGFVGSAINWGWYSKGDRNKKARIRPPAQIGDDPRKKCAWNWVVVNRTVQAFLENIPVERKIYMPFENYKNQDVHGVKRLYGHFGLPVPAESEIVTVLRGNEFRNRNHSNITFPKTWGEFDAYASAISRTFAKEAEGGQAC